MSNPISSIFGFIFWLLREIHQQFLCLFSTDLPENLYVIGSTQMGGIGRTNLSLSLANHFKSQGHHVEILCHSLGRKEFTLNQSSRFPEATDDALFLNSHGFRVHQVKNRSKWFKNNIYDSSTIFICDGGIEDPVLKKAKIILLEEERANYFSQLLPFGKHRSLNRQHLNPWLRLIKNQDYYFEFKSPLSASDYLICSGGSPKSFEKALKNFGFHFNQSIYRPNHDVKFQIFIENFLDRHPHVKIHLGSKEIIKLNYQKLPDSINLIEMSIILRQPWSTFLNSEHA